MKLALFFTRGISLKIWIESGLFDREKLIYEEYIKNGNFEKIYWITYGKDDKTLTKSLKESKRLYEKINIIPMPRLFNCNAGKLFYSFLIPFVHRKYLKNIDILKTNQIDGAWSAVISKWLYKKPLIVRAGYLPSMFSKGIKRGIFKFLEKNAYKKCDIGVVASQQDKGYVCNEYKIDQDKIQVIHNYIDTGLFKPVESEKFEDRIIFVGRLVKQKNLFNLIRAVSKTNLIIDIYGDGKLRRKLESYARDINAKVNFMGIVSNNIIPIILNKYKYYILPSFYEGMPKTLLEAMACGCVCIGTKVIGISEVIEDGVTGYLAKNADHESILKVLNLALGTDNEKIIKNGIEKIQKDFSLKNYFKKESEIVNKLIYKSDG